MKNVFIVGCGNMGKAIISGLIKNGYSPSFITGIDIDKNKLSILKSQYNINISVNFSVIKEEAIIVIAVKPDNVDQILTKLNNLINPKKHLILSIAAGVKIEEIENIIGKDFLIARCMPNIAAMVGKSTTVICFNSKVTDTIKTDFLTISNSIGISFEIEEQLFDAVTGLSGSGPAYLFLMVESMADAGVLMGIPRETSLNLALNTVLGSAEFLDKMKLHPAVAKEMVTSPGGTTIEALLTLEDGAFKGLIMKAVKKATEKSIQLGKKL